MFTFNYPSDQYPSSNICIFTLDNVIDNPSPARDCFINTGALLIRPRLTTFGPEDITTALSNVGALFGRRIVRDAYRRSASFRKKGLNVDPDFVHRPHAEASFSPVHPAVLAFACIHQSDEDDIGGLTTLIDGTNLWDQTSSTTKHCLLKANLEYKLRIQVKPRPASSNTIRPWFLHEIGVRDTFLDMKNGHLTFTYSKPFLHYHHLSREIVIANHAFIDVNTEEQILSRSCLFEDSLTPEEISAAVRETMTTLDSNIKVLSWRQGDIVVLDNMRYMHGRLPAVNGLKRSLKILQYKAFLL